MHRKHSLGKPDQKDLNENLAATHGLAHMIAECKKLFQVCAPQSIMGGGGGGQRKTSSDVSVLKCLLEKVGCLAHCKNAYIQYIPLYKDHIYIYTSIFASFEKVCTLFSILFAEVLSLMNLGNILGKSSLKPCFTLERVVKARFKPQTTFTLIMRGM